MENNYLKNLIDYAFALEDETINPDNYTADQGKVFDFLINELGYSKDEAFNIVDYYEFIIYDSVRALGEEMYNLNTDFGHRFDEYSYFFEKILIKIIDFEALGQIYMDDPYNRFYEMPDGYILELYN